jgi:hypothetical protein
MCLPYLKAFPFFLTITRLKLFLIIFCVSIKNSGQNKNLEGKWYTEQFSKCQKPKEAKIRKILTVETLPGSEMALNCKSFFIFLILYQGYFGKGKDY